MTVELEIPQWLLDNWHLVLLPLNWLVSIPAIRSSSRAEPCESELQRNLLVGTAWIFSPIFNIIHSTGKTIEFLGKVVNWRNHT